MGNEVWNDRITGKTALAVKRLTAFLLAVLLAVTLLPAVPVKAAQQPPSLTIGGQAVTPGNTGIGGLSMNVDEDGVFILTVEQPGDISIGAIEAEGSLVIEGGEGRLTIDAAGKRHGIFVSGDLTIRTADVAVSGGRAAAVYATGDISVEESRVKAQGLQGSKGMISGRFVSVFHSWIQVTGNSSDLSEAENSIVFQEQDGVLSGVVTEGAEESEGTVLTQDVTLPGNLEVPEGAVLVIPENITLTVPANYTLTVSGGIINRGTIVIQGILEDDGEQILNEADGKVTGVPVKEIILETPDETTLRMEESIVLSANVVPYYAENPAVTWNTSDGSIASVENGTVRGLLPGEAVITAETANGSKAECPITVLGMAVTGVSLDRTAAQMYIGDTLQLKETVTPEKAENKRVTWSSSNEAAASVSENGLVTAQGAGTAIITVTTEEGNQTAECAITVLGTAVTGVSLNQTAAQLYRGETLQLEAAVAPISAENKKVAWSSSNEAAASVSENGLVTAQGIGTAVITVTTEDGKKTAECTVTVLGIPVANVSIDKAEAHMYVRDTLQLKETVTPENAENKKVTWSSSNEAAASVSENGLVTAQGAGTAVITVTTEDGKKTAECTITVEAVPVTEITLEPASTTLPLGKTLALKTRISPENATNPKVTWSSSDTSAASVTQDGLVKALKEGTVTITATAEDGSGITGTSEITVIVIPVTKVAFKKASVTIPDDGTVILKADVFPADATDKTLTWKSKNPKAATVDAHGKVTAVKAGTTQIIAASADGKHEAVCTVTVAPPDKEANAAALNQKIKMAWNGKKKAMTVSWGKAPDADGYEIYAAECGKDMKLVKTISGTKTRSFTFKKVNGRKLKAQSSYKAQVRAYRIFHGRKQYLAKSYSVHTVLDSNKKYTNVKKLTVSPKNLTLRLERSRKLNVKSVPQDSRKKLVGHIQKLRYFTSDSKVAVVSGNGTVKAVGKGTCTVYVLSVNGAKSSVKVTVK